VNTQHTHLRSTQQPVPSTQPYPPPTFPLNPPPAAFPVPPPSLPPVTVGATLPTPYQTILDQLLSVSRRLDQQEVTLSKHIKNQEVKLAEILQALTTNFPTQTEWMESIVSPITSTIHSEGDSIHSHQLIASNKQQSNIMEPIEAHTQAIIQLTSLTQQQMDATNKANASLDTITSQTNLLFSQVAKDVKILRNYANNFMTERSKEPETSGISTATLNTSIPPREDSPIKELDVEYPAPPSTTGECFLCHQESNDLRYCETCELPFDSACILTVRNQDTDQDEYQCISCQNKYHPQSLSEGLTEFSDEDLSHPTDTTQTMESFTTDPLPTTLGTTQKDDTKKSDNMKGLRPKGATSPRKTHGGRTTPPKTRTRSGCIPPAPNE
jgi:hypothetical protein